jgi:glucoamylase
VETPAGPLYHRYNGDGYGEHEDGEPFDGTGIGRVWPLLTGERGHFALDAGEDPLPYLETMRRTAGGCGLLPEQAWDAAPIPARGLQPGRPTGSAMPLVWAHAEFLKLFMARHQGRPCERLPAVAERYRNPRVADTWHWRADSRFHTLPPQRHLVIEDARPFTLRLGFDGWQNTTECAADVTGLGLYGVRLTAGALAPMREINFTRRFGDTWEGSDYTIALAPTSPARA